MRYHLRMVKAKTVESQCVPAGSTTKGIVLPGNAFLLENVVSFSFYNLLTHGQVPKLLKSFCLCTYLFEIILNIWEPSSLSFRKIYDVIDAGLSVFRTLWSCHSRLIIFQHLSTAAVALTKNTLHARQPVLLTAAAKPPLLAAVPLSAE